MSDTQAILRRIAALRQRLDQAQSPARDTAAAPIREHENADPVVHLEQKVAVGARHNALIDATLRPLAAPAIAETAAPASPRLTARAARILLRGRQLLAQLRALTEEPMLQADSPHALGDLYQETTAMLDTVLRTLAVFPDAPAAQARLCDGLDAVLNVVLDRLNILQPSLDLERRHAAQIDRLARLFHDLGKKVSVSVTLLQPMADAILDDARRESPLRFFSASPANPARFVACHSLTVAQVIARLALTDSHWQGRLDEPILAALLHDAGMAAVPAAVLAQPGPLTDDQRSLVERHTRHGARLIERMDGHSSWLVEAAAHHHERSDGTGYPDGVLEAHLSPLVRLLIVGDIYAALCTPRPYRAALEPRAALTETLMLADQGAIDRLQAERLLRISFFPVGSVVELSDGCSGVVLAPPQVRNDRIDPAKPLVALLADAHHLPLPVPRCLDLAREGEPSVVRLLPANQRRELLGRRFPALAG